MRTLRELQDRLSLHGPAEYIYDPNVGHLSWHYGTGDNIEMLFIEVVGQGKGHGLELYRRMVRRVLDSGRQPYHSVYAFRLKSNEAARQFYCKMGWSETQLGQCVYGGDETALMWITWKELVAQFFPGEAPCR